MSHVPCPAHRNNDPSTADRERAIDNTHAEPPYFCIDVSPGSTSGALGGSIQQYWDVVGKRESQTRHEAVLVLFATFLHS